MDASPQRGSDMYPPPVCLNRIARPGDEPDRQAPVRDADRPRFQERVADVAPRGPQIIERLLFIGEAVP